MPPKPYSVLRRYHGALAQAADCLEIPMKLPYAQDEVPVELALTRETFVRVGPRVNGVSKIKRRLSNHTYVAGRLRFDPKSRPPLRSLHRISFIAATCFPNPDLPSKTTDLM